ncbi:MAG: aminotransferase class I/II-fold pyridoxal phosphate-dependent enzyme [bacterium]
MDLFDRCRSFTRAKETMAAGVYPYFKAIQSGAGSEVIIDGRKMIMIGSNNYLGLTNHPKVKEAAVGAIERYGTGCTGSRFLNGTLDIHEELEERLAAFVRKEAALVFSTGFQTNLGAISTLVGKDDLIFTDRSDHASIVDGCRLAFGKTIKYRHNDMKDLARVLEAHRDKDVGKIIVTDGVFSMEGDVVNLPELVGLAEKYNARVYVDDAHSIGVLGDHGRGTADHFGLGDRVDLIMGTFSKSFASLGGFIAGEEPVIHYIKHYSRALIFSASMPPSAVATVLACLDIMESDTERMERLWKNTRKMKEAFDNMGFNTGQSQTPIIPIRIGEDEDCFLFWREVFDRGIFANTAISPAVPPHEAIIRTSYMATHTDEQLDRVLETFHKVGKAVGVI